MELKVDLPIPQRLDPRFTPGKQLGKRPIWYACYKDDCTYILKKISIPTYDPICFPAEAIVQNEILLSELAGQLNIGPRIYAKAFNSQGGEIVMDKYDGTLNELIFLSQSGYPSIPLENILLTVKQLIMNLHANNIVHRDIHPGNIFYTTKGIIALADYGQSRLSSKEEDREKDWRYFQQMEKVIQRVRAGAKYDLEDAYWNLMGLYEGPLSRNLRFCGTDNSVTTHSDQSETSMKTLLELALNRVV